jgi:hypothetical protein
MGCLMPVALPHPRLLSCQCRQRKLHTSPLWGGPAAPLSRSRCARGSAIESGDAGVGASLHPTRRAQESAPPSPSRGGMNRARPPSTKFLAGLKPARDEGSGAPNDRNAFKWATMRRPARPASAPTRLSPVPRAARTPPADMDPGFPTEAGNRDGPRWSVTPAARAATTLLQMRSPPRAQLSSSAAPCPTCQDGPDTLSLMGQGGRSLREARRPGISVSDFRLAPQEESKLSLGLSALRERRTRAYRSRSYGGCIRGLRACSVSPEWAEILPLLPRNSPPKGPGFIYQPVRATTRTGWLRA